MPNPGYTTTEKMIAEIVAAALEDLGNAADMIEREGWKHLEDKNLKMLQVGVSAAINSQKHTHAAARAIIDANHEPQLNRMAAWTGFPQDEPMNKAKGAKP